MVGMVRADPAGPKLIMNDAIKRIGLLRSRLTSVRWTRAAVEIKEYLAACESKPAILAVRLL